MEEAESQGARAELVPILSAMRRLELNEGNKDEAQLLQDRVEETVGFIAETFASDERKTMFLNSPFAKAALSDELIGSPK